MPEARAKYRGLKYKTGRTIREEAEGSGQAASSVRTSTIAPIKAPTDKTTDPIM
jgi:hypothetical protein